jgi:hypothetical protein
VMRIFGLVRLSSTHEYRHSFGSIRIVVLDALFLHVLASDGVFLSCWPLLDLWVLFAQEDIMNPVFLRW